MRNAVLIAVFGVVSAGFFLFGCDDDAEEDPTESPWSQSYITEVEPILMQEPFLEMLGQTVEPVTYTYEDAVRLAGHSCGAVSSAWTITRKALEALYPGETPVRGQIKIEMPGAATEWYVGVFGEVMTYITGAAPETGFPGGEFGPNYNRRNLMIYRETPSGTPPAAMVWIFERIDTGARVGVTLNLALIQPPANAEFNAVSAKMGAGTATAEEAEWWVKAWNDRALFVFENADTLAGFVTVQTLP